MRGACIRYIPLAVRKKLSSLARRGCTGSFSDRTIGRPRLVGRQALPTSGTPSPRTNSKSHHPGQYRSNSSLSYHTFQSRTDTFLPLLSKTHLRAPIHLLLRTMSMLHFAQRSASSDENGFDSFFDRLSAFELPTEVSTCRPVILSQTVD